MKEAKNILLTFDYELFLGNRSGTPEKCLLEPTEEILALLSEYKYKGIFFVDTTYLLKLEEAAADSGSVFAAHLSQIKKQIQKIILQGHYVFPHLHPHWLDATFDYDNKEWNFYSVKKYRFYNLSKQEQDNLFSRSIAILKEIIDPVMPGYVIDGYRAGGWSIQPFEDFKYLFEKFNMKFDFSVIPGSEFLGEAQYYDFKSVPDKQVYRFSNDVCIEDPSGRFIEMPISKLQFKKGTIILNKIFLRFLMFFRLNSSFGKGISVPFSTDMSNFKEEEVLSLELLSYIKLSSYKRYIAKNVITHFNSHPKMITRHNLAVLKILLRYIQSRYLIETDFRKITL